MNKIYENRFGSPVKAFLFCALGLVLFICMLPVMGVMKLLKRW